MNGGLPGAAETAPPRAGVAAVRVRFGRADDAPAMAALLKRAFAAYPVPIVPPSSALRETAAPLAEPLARGQVGIAEFGRDIAGCIVWAPNGDGIYLGRLAVDPACRWRGIGRGLLRFAEQVAREAGARRLTLETRIALPDNHRLFAACGFREVSRHAHPGFAAPTFIRMEKTL